MTRLKGKVCLVTAAGQGIGRAVALAMKREGGTVLATDINEKALSDLSAKGITTHRLDVCDRQAIETIKSQIPAIDVLFNCAGYVAHGTILDCDEEQWSFSQDLNVTGMYRMIRAFLPVMLKNQGGSIINMSSVVSSIIAAPNRFVYGTTKAAIIGLTKSVAADFVTEKIRCNAICPGTVATPSLEDRLHASGDYEEARKAFIARQPMGRIGSVDEISSLAMYLASDESSFTTGIAHVVDGGWSNV